MERWYRVKLRLISSVCSVPQVLADVCSSLTSVNADCFAEATPSSTTHRGLVCLPTKHAQHVRYMLVCNEQ